MTVSDSHIDNMLKRLHLANTRRTWREALERAESQEQSYRQFFTELVSHEISHRSDTGVKRRLRAAKFPFLRTINDFDFKVQSALRPKMLGSYLSPEMVACGKSLVLHGKPGRGKTHLAVAVAYKAILNGFDALFVTAAQLIEDLSTASRAGALHVRLKRYTAPSVLVIDELGYLTLGDNAANVLYHVVNARYLKTKPMIFTTNKGLALWGNVLHDDDLAETIIDRVLENGRMITLDGPSMRTNQHAHPA